MLLLPLGFLAVMVAAPLRSLAFYDGEGAWGEVVADDYMRLRLGWSVAQADLTCVLVTALGVPGAWVLARLDLAGRRTVLR
ncbi:iron ABC transporter permease, partial [Neisseria sp. P0009.S004]